MRSIMGGKIGLLRERDGKVVAFFHVFADAFDARFDDVITGGAADDVEHFQDRHAAADELREGAGETRHADLVNERTEDRQLQLPACPRAVCRALERRKVRMPKNTPPTPRIRKYHSPRMKSLTSIRN